MPRPTIMSDADHGLVSAAVAQAEAHTAGEIVTILAERSDGYSDIALAWAALAAMTVLTLLSLWPEPALGLYDRAFGQWGSEWTHRGVLALGTSAAILTFIAAVLLQMIQPIKFALVPSHIKALRVRARAITCFKVGAERRTQGRTGVLIYLSMREHRAEIVADEAIAGKVAPDIWAEAMDAMLREIRGGRIAEGMSAAVARVGVVLAEHFPRAENDVNELPDRLIEV